MISLNRVLGILGVSAALFASQIAGAGQPVPTATPYCLDGYGRNVPINDPQVLGFKQSIQNEAPNPVRAHVYGVMVAGYADQTGHAHFGIQIGQATTDTVEIIYDLLFGTLPAIPLGTRVEACGDYFTANAPAKGYPASPDGAIIHWVHLDPKRTAGAHPDGFLVLNGEVFGTDLSHASNNYTFFRRGAND